MSNKIDNTSMSILKSSRQEIENDYILDELVDVAWPFTLLIIVFMLYKPLKKLMESLANNLGKAREVTIGGVSWKTTDLESAVTDLEILKAIITTAYIDKDISSEEINAIVQKIDNMDCHINNITKESKEKVLTESINMAGIDNKIDEEEYVLLRSRAKNLSVDFERIDELLLDICVTRNITPPTQLNQPFDLKKKEYGNIK